MHSQFLIFDNDERASASDKSRTNEVIGLGTGLAFRTLGDE
jgi:hypothetical protein